MAPDGTFRCLSEEEDVFLRCAKVLAEKWAKECGSRNHQKGQVSGS